MKVKTLNRTLGVIALTALCGCVDPTPPLSASATPKEPPASSGPIALTVPPASSGAGKPAATAKRHDDHKPAAVPATAPATETAQVQIVGMNEGEVQALLGTPSMVEDHAPAKPGDFANMTAY